MITRLLDHGDGTDAAMALGVCEHGHDGAVPPQPVQMVNGDSRDPASWPLDRAPVLAFVDGSHDAETALCDLGHAWWRLASRRRAGLHDYDLTHRDDPASGVDLAWEEWLAGVSGDDGPHMMAGSSIVWVRRAGG